MQPGDKVFAESGQLSWMSMAIQMQTSTTAGGQQGGFLGALGRAVAGGTLFMTEYTSVGGPGLLTFSAKLPGQILPVEITPSSGYLVHRHGKGGDPSSELIEDRPLLICGLLWAATCAGVILLGR